MIKLDSHMSDVVNFVCSSQDEIDFCKDHKDEIFNDFIRHQTKGKFKTLAEYILWYYEPPEFGTESIKAKWYQTKQWGLEWNIDTTRKLQSMFNDAYNRKKILNMNKEE